MTNESPVPWPEVVKKLLPFIVGGLGLGGGGIIGYQGNERAAAAEARIEVLFDLMEMFHGQTPTRGPGP